VVEADRDWAALLCDHLLADGYHVELAHCVEQARQLARLGSPALVVVGSLGPGRGAIALVEEIRDSAGLWDVDVPTVVLDAGAAELDVLRAFEAGADDVIARRVDYRELRARLRALLCRASVARGQGRVLAVESLRVDTATRIAMIGGTQLVLRRVEFELLTHLAREPRRVFSRVELLDAVWGYNAAAKTRTLEAHASRLRHKLQHRDSRRWVVNVRGVGYRLL
jgi:DNA-binding response OmpR family regulator